MVQCHVNVELCVLIVGAIEYCFNYVWKESHWVTVPMVQGSSTAMKSVIFMMRDTFQHQKLSHNILI